VKFGAQAGDGMMLKTKMMLLLLLLWLVMAHKPAK
jgi:hypothetical protein